MLLAICYREISQEKLTLFHEELQKRERKGMGWQEEIDSLFSSLSLPDFEISREKSAEPQKPKSNAQWYNILEEDNSCENFQTWRKIVRF
jgi:hypothetical protein